MKLVINTLVSESNSKLADLRKQEEKLKKELLKVSRQINKIVINKDAKKSRIYQDTVETLTSMSVPKDKMPQYKKLVSSFIASVENYHSVNAYNQTLDKGKTKEFKAANSELSKARKELFIFYKNLATSKGIKPTVDQLTSAFQHLIGDKIAKAKSKGYAAGKTLAEKELDI